MNCQDSDLFEFCVAQLKVHLLRDSGKKAVAAAREDQLEYSLILMDLLYQMMRETHLFSKKLVMLTRSGGQLLRNLATAVVHYLPAPMSNDSEVCEILYDNMLLPHHALLRILHVHVP